MKKERVSYGQIHCMNLDLDPPLLTFICVPSLSELRITRGICIVYHCLPGSRTHPHMLLWSPWQVMPTWFTLIPPGAGQKAVEPMVPPLKITYSRDQQCLPWVSSSLLGNKHVSQWKLSSLYLPVSCLFLTSFWALIFPMGSFTILMWSCLLEI